MQTVKNPHKLAIDLLCNQSFTWIYECSGYCRYSETSDDIRNIGGYELSEIELEYKIGNYRVDIAILSDSASIKGVIEVCDTHKIGKEKWEYFNNNNIRCIEVDAQSVIDVSEVGGFIKCICNNLDCYRCEPAKNAQKRTFIAKTQVIAKKLDIELPTAYYRYAPDKCWKCRKDIILYTYPGCNESLGGVPSDPTHEPIPSTLKKLFMYDNWQYANVCPHCESLQGNFFIYHEPEGVFFCIGDIIDSQEAYESDMEDIILYHDKDW